MHAGTVAWCAAPAAPPPPPPPRWVHGTAPELRRLLGALRALADAGAAAAPAALGGLMSPAALLALGVIADDVARAQRGASGGGGEGFEPRVYGGAARSGGGGAPSAGHVAAGFRQGDSGSRAPAEAVQAEWAVRASGGALQSLGAFHVLAQGPAQTAENVDGGSGRA